MLLLAPILSAKAYTSDLGNGTYQNPVMYADYPDNSKWSLYERLGWLRLKTNYAADLLQARNTLTQRIQEPTSSGWVKLDTTNINDKEIAGLSAFHSKYGYIAVRNDNGVKKLVQYNVSGSEKSVNLTNNIVYLKVNTDCNAQTAKFYYSYDESNWRILFKWIFSTSYGL